MRRLIPQKTNKWRLVKNGFERSNTRGRRTSRGAAAVPQVRDGGGRAAEGSTWIYYCICLQRLLSHPSPLWSWQRRWGPCRYFISFSRKAEDDILILHAPNSHLIISSLWGKSQNKRSLLGKKRRVLGAGVCGWDAGSGEEETPHQVMLLEPGICPYLATAQAS